MIFPSLPFFLAILSFVSAADVILNWSIGWVSNVNPDGKFPRRAIGVNGQWPLPQIYVIRWDTITINVQNNLDVPTAIHTHGLFENKTFFEDGAPFVTECGIAPGSNYTYRIVASQSGSFWFHGHLFGQYVDGFRTPLIISEPVDSKEPYIEEIVLAVADWYHQEHAPLLDQYLSPQNPDGEEPVPDSVILQNGPKEIFLMPRKTYKIRLISMAAFASFHFWIDNHDFTIVEVDGINVKPFKSSGIPIAAAQRYSILITAKTVVDKNYHVHFQVDQSMLPSNCPNPSLDIPLIYNPYPRFVPPTSAPSSLVNFDQTLIEPVQSMTIATPTLRLIYNVTFELYENENKQQINRGAFNNNPYIQPKVPSGLSVFSNSSKIRDPEFYGISTNPQILNNMDVVQLVINNFDSGSHPFHVHGHVFQVLYTSNEEDGPFNSLNTSISLTKRPNPLRRDVTVVPAKGFAIIQFTADNPGIWFFHCHIEWHLAAGLAATFIESPQLIKESISVPSSLLDQCKLQNIPTTGNYAGVI